MRKETFVGREKEQAILRKALTSYEAEMIAIIGRRRIGKTYLIKETYKGNIVFEITGLQNAPLSEQLENFTYWLQKISNSKISLPTPKNWLKAFMMLIDYLETLDTSTKKVVFLDELPWLSTHRSGFLRALGFFWNSWAVNKNIVVVICGSAASWMIRKVVNHSGGLHNRITQLIFLKPFNLAETKTYLEARNIHFNLYQIIQLYMALGGVPHYLKEIDGTKSAVQNIDSICFSDFGLLKNEFERLYPSLFENAEKHVKIIRALAKSNQGLTRGLLVKATQLPENGNLSKVLDELSQSGFISIYQPFGKKKKDSLYRLTDEYSLFYLQFIEKHQHDGESTWQHLSQTQSYKTWSGYAYENICLKHLSEIKRTLGIAGVYSVSSSFYKKGTTNEKGVQIDLLIDRNDNVINIVEVKFYNQEFTLTKVAAKKLQQKIWAFQAATNTRKQLFLTLITTFGLKQNQHSLGLVHQVLKLEDLFE
ncbi:MAG: AAA family ATPase [Saprospiraceae bacterium]